MNTTRVSATSARNNFFELLDKVAQGAKIVVEKDAKEIAVIMPRSKKTDWKGLRKAMNEAAAAGVLKDYNFNDNPLRRPDAADFLGKWDRDLVKKKKQ